MSKIPHATDVLQMLLGDVVVQKVDQFGDRLEQVLVKTLGNASWLEANGRGAVAAPLSANQDLDSPPSLCWTVELPGEAPDGVTRYAVECCLLDRGYSRVTFHQKVGVVNRTCITVYIDFPPLL